MTTNEPLEQVEELRDATHADGPFAGYEDGYDDGFESDADETEGYEPEAYAIGPYRPAPLPWYRDRRTMSAIAVIGAAVVAIVVCTSLLVFRPQRSQSIVVDPPASSTKANPSPTTVAGPAPSPTTAITVTATATASTLPVAVPAKPQPSAARPPEIDVTRTPLTRTPISVHPGAVPHTGPGQ